MLVWPITLLTTPAGAVIYSRGFEYAIQKDPGIEVLQEWAIKTLKDFDTGQVDWTHHPDYWRPGNVPLPLESLPDFLRNGVFSATIRQGKGPEVSVQANANGATCVVISWYLHGLLVGPSDYETNWSPFYLKQLAPGVYSYHIEK
jgi:hypothetical protein